MFVHHYRDRHHHHYQSTPNLLGSLPTLQFLPIMLVIRKMFQAFVLAESPGQCKRRKMDSITSCINRQNKSGKNTMAKLTEYDLDLIAKNLPPEPSLP